jgi:hypothetical protein
VRSSHRPLNSNVIDRCLTHRQCQPRLLIEDAKVSRRKRLLNETHTLVNQVKDRSLKAI